MKKYLFTRSIHHNNQQLPRTLLRHFARGTDAVRTVRKLASTEAFLYAPLRR